jgi:hypothetical protein
LKSYRFLVTGNHNRPTDSGAGLDTGKGQVEIETRGRTRLGDTLFGQIEIPLAGEPNFKIPGRLSSTRTGRIRLNRSTRYHHKKIAAASS